MREARVTKDRTPRVCPLDPKPIPSPPRERTARLSRKHNSHLPSRRQPRNAHAAINSQPIRKTLISGFGSLQRRPVSSPSKETTPLKLRAGEVADRRGRGPERNSEADTASQLLLLPRCQISCCWDLLTLSRLQ